MVLRVFAGILAAVLLALPASAQTGSGARWVGSWAASQQIPEERNALAPHDQDDATLRQTVHLSFTGRSLRVRLSNAFGTAPLRITAAHIARALAPGSDAIDPSSDIALRF